MFRIEDNLLLKKDKVDLSLLNVIDEYYKEMHMLISNIHLTHVLMKENVGKVFPLETNLYDGSWYKNLLIASNIIFDRLHMIIDENIPYDSIFKDKNKCNFRALANVWNKINFIVKYNLPDSLWNEKATNWNLISTSRKIEEILASRVDINYHLLETISLDLNKYKSVPKVLVEKNDHSYQELVNVLSGNKSPSTESVSSQQPSSQPQPNTFGFNNQQPQPPFNQGFNNQTPPSFTPQQPTPPPPTQTSLVVEHEQKAPINPLKKELDAIVRWCDLKQESIRTYIENKKYGYDRNEYKKICEYLPIVQSEIAEIDELLNVSRIRMPIDPLKSEMDKLTRWCNEKEKYVKLYKRNKGLDASNQSSSQERLHSLRQELNQIIKSLESINIEINYIDNQMNAFGDHLPKDPMIKELKLLLKWIDIKEDAVNIYKRNLRKSPSELLNDSDDELKRIEKEMSFINDQLSNISSNDQNVEIQIQEEEEDIETNNNKVDKDSINDELARIKKEMNVIEQDVVADELKLINKKLYRISDPQHGELPYVKKELRIANRKLNNQQSANDNELIRINKEMRYIDNKINQLDNINKNSYNQEIIAINDKLLEINKDLRLINDETKNVELKSTNNQNNSDYLKAKRLSAWVYNKEKELLALQKKLTNKLYLIQKYDEEIIKFKDGLILAEDKYSQYLDNLNSSSNTNSNLIITNHFDDIQNNESNNKSLYTEDNISNVVDQLLSSQDSIANNIIDENIIEEKLIVNPYDLEIQAINNQRKIIKQELEIINDELVELNELYKNQMINENEFEQRYEYLIKKYNIEAKILQKAFEILPDELRDSANAQLPEMIELLLQEGYIVPKEDKSDKSKKVVKIIN